jgi:small subunit ribosomal protein S17
MKKLIGRVVSSRMNKTIVVAIGREIVHPLYKKIMRRTTKIKAHCEDPRIKEGNMVKIISCRPISKEKHYKVVEKI